MIDPEKEPSMVSLVHSVLFTLYFVQ